VKKSLKRKGKEEGGASGIYEKKGSMSLYDAPTPLRKRRRTRFSRGGGGAESIPRGTTPRQVLFCIVQGGERRGLEGEDHDISAVDGSPVF